MRVVICGAGIIGASLAYFLSRRGVRATIVERHRVAGSASGHAGGFLARDWCAGSALGAFARASFDLHAELARVLPGDIGYRRIDTLLVTAGRRSAVRGIENVAWLDGNCRAERCLGIPATTAQVHPGKLTRALLKAAMDRGAELRLGRVEGVSLGAGGGRITGVRVDGEAVPADAVVIAMGPWSRLASGWLPLPPVFGLKGHSIRLRPRKPIPAQALFVEGVDGEADAGAPEIFPRPDGEVYVCGVTDRSPLPVDPAEVGPTDADAWGSLRRLAASLSSCLAEADLVGVGACYRPVAADGLPVLGAIRGVDGAYVATGHSCWGILNAPASGLALAEVLLDGASTTFDIRPFSPERCASLFGSRAS